MSLENTATPSSPAPSPIQARMGALLDALRPQLESMPTERTFFWTSISLWLGFWALFIGYIQFPQGLNFDEFHYIPAARQFLQMVENKNYEHPPLAKELIAIGMSIFGDRPIGWRFMSTIFGALTVLGTYVAGLALFRTQLSALFVALLTGFNNMVYVQSRIAMLDTFMMGFLIGAFALGLCALFPLHSAPTPEAATSRNRRNLYLSGAALGLACACKWFALVPWAMVLGMALLLALMNFWRVRFEAPTAAPSFAPFHPLPDTGLSQREFAIAWIAIPVIAYYSAFLPFLWITKSDGTTFTLREILVKMQWRMWDGQLHVVSPHPYASKWTQWPLMTRPIWYAFEPLQDKQWVRGVFLIGNPLILWGGLAAVAWTFWDWIRSRTFAAFWISAAYAAFTFSWVLIPRKIAFFFYYYPSAIILGFAIAYTVKRSSEDLHPEDSPRTPIVLHLAVIAATLAFFVYFLPVLSAWKIPFNDYRNWTWFRSWI